MKKIMVLGFLILLGIFLVHLYREGKLRMVNPSFDVMSIQGIKLENGEVLPVHGYWIIFSHEDGKIEVGVVGN